MYYGALIINEAIGTFADTKIAELAVNNTATAAYGIYENGRLARAVLINFNTFLPTVNSTRTNEVVSLGGFKATGAVSIRRFYTPASNATSGL